ncbi:MAG: FecR domain-containing protein, partial [Alphaproteobacteria bacterium]|nr:FecR domain-containing protein [Alphaproteobacteria bacterium]
MKNFPEKFLSNETAVQPPSTSQGEQPPVVISANDMMAYLTGNKLVLPVGNEILDADFTRSGRDLMVDMDGKNAYLVTNYYAQEHLPALVSNSGKQIRPETIKVLAGDPAANQYAGPVEGAAPIGSIGKIAGKVYVNRGGEEVQLDAGAEVYQNDIIRTEDDGSVGITFVDGSVFSLGNDARMTLDSLVYDPSTGEGASEVTVLKGMFKFVSGDIAANNPGDMVVETPVATIGIRGTTGGGNVQGPGMENQFFLEPNADGTVGWFDVTTEAGTISMNQPYMQVSMDSIHSAPPAPDFTTQEALTQQFQPINDIMPEGRYDTRPDSENAAVNAPSQEALPQETTANASDDSAANAEAAPQTSEEPVIAQTDDAPAAEEPVTEDGASEEVVTGEEMAADGELAESSELLELGNTNPQTDEALRSMDTVAEQEASEAMNAGETTAEGTNSDQLIQTAA